MENPQNPIIKTLFANILVDFLTRTNIMSFKKYHKINVYSL